MIRASLFLSLYAFPNCISGVSSGLAFEDNALQEHSVPQISAVAAYSKGFACSPSPGVVLLFEKTMEKELYKESQEVWVRSKKAFISNYAAELSLENCVSDSVIKNNL